MNTTATSFTQACLEAIADGGPYPTFENSDIHAAYNQQLDFVNAQKRNISGYKAALTAAPAQKAMGIDQPIVGCLFKEGASQPSDLIQIDSGVLETELGFTLAQSISTPVTEANVLDTVLHCQPMVEIARPNLSAKPKAVHLIATNSASFAYIAGEPFDPRSIEIDGIEASLREREEIFRGTCGEVMGGQRKALAWLINTALDIGYHLEAGHLMMTGSVGGVAPAKPGTYTATFTATVADLGQIEFTIA